ncbi:MAG: tyrosine-type recombinase/integrase [Candidatus Kaistia colombiensis]|nr:MAG: tyrosine-type recombinase/integrase [Kaistia sp.]
MRSFANYVLAVFSILFSFAIELELAETNPIAKVKKVRRATDARKVNRPWTLAEREAVFAAAPPHLLLPIAIGRWVGMREGDVLRMPKASFDGKTIRVVTGKRGVPIAVPAAAPLQAIIGQALQRASAPGKDGQARPQTITLCANSRSKPWTGSGFRSSFFKLIRDLEDRGEIGTGLTFHGLRHTVATELRQLGYDSRAIADMPGQKTQAQADHYSAEADLEMKMRGVVQKMERANTRGTKLSRKRDKSV